MAVANGRKPNSATGLITTRLTRLGICRYQDLLLHLPIRYEDETRIWSITDAPANTPVQIQGVVHKTYVQPKPRRMLICHIRDENGELILRFLHFYGSQIKQLEPGTQLRVFGEIRQGFFGVEMVHPRYRLDNHHAPERQTLTPVYPTTAGLSQNTLRKLIDNTLSESDLSDTLPTDLLKRLEMPSFAESITTLHHPPPNIPLDLLESRQHPAWRRLKLDELLAQQLSMRLHYKRRQNHTAPNISSKGEFAQKLLSRLPFDLTEAQARSIQEIRADISKGHPMQRLLQGDVGCGKTLVALIACLDAIEAGFQAAIMAPTEILAEQHTLKAQEWLSPAGIKIAALFSGMSQRERQTAMAEIASGEANLIIGTHALIQEGVKFFQLGLSIIDEQHRFGVKQRLKLRQKGLQPHQLMLSATPIPRTLSMSYYADLDVSTINELPPGRTPVITRLINDSRRDEVMQRIEAACAQGRQAYWVCPLIEESETLELQTAMDTYEELKLRFPHLEIGLVHSRKTSKEKAQVMKAFSTGQIHLLVATTVIEVGVDVPNASLMVIDHAERMGLAQLHQLRGRVGRGKSQSACVLLFQTPLSELARARLRVIAEHTNGFEIAREDLRIRGPGEFLGARQSGTPMLRFADIEQDLDLLEEARKLSIALINNRDTVQRHLDRWLGQAADFLLA
ncbi:MAG: ATP-dependent DNA helicase RecG [Pseudomonadota bacterium]|nr:ATP-dependent DNA helicase RecG [Pseudomonadota bacterium]